GPSIPRRDRDADRERYCRLMLILFHPWRDPRDLKSPAETWEDAFSRCRNHFSPQALSVMDNLQLLHECRDSRND
ncbi:hypothetical protein C2E23DRAFT_709142, partial [Lenzites betulinus]